jgi:hypothetical protein
VHLGNAETLADLGLGERLVSPATMDQAAAALD